jgi:hypothetical protein
LKKTASEEAKQVKKTLILALIVASIFIGGCERKDSRMLMDGGNNTYYNIHKAFYASPSIPDNCYYEFYPSRILDKGTKHEAITMSYLIRVCKQLE